MGNNHVYTMGSFAMGKFNHNFVYIDSLHFVMSIVYFDSRIKSLLGTCSCFVYLIILVNNSYVSYNTDTNFTNNTVELTSQKSLEKNSAE